MKQGVSQAGGHLRALLMFAQMTIGIMNFSTEQVGGGSRCLAPTHICINNLSVGQRAGQH